MSTAIGTSQDCPHDPADQRADDTKSNLGPSGPSAPSAPANSRRVLGRASAFWIVALTTTVLLAASSAPSPLYPVYERKFAFSPLTLTVIFAVYVAALLAMLLTAGRLSDHVGRRPVLLAALIVEAGAMALFLVADGVTWLIVARVVQGLATGTAIGALGAMLLDLQPPTGSRLGSLVNSLAPTAGLAVGAVVTGVLVEYAPAPTRLIFAVLLAVFVVLAATVAVLPEPVARTKGALAALRPRIAVPSTARGAFIGTVPVIGATWALGGLVLSLGSSLLSATFGVSSVALVGVLIAVLPAAGAVAGFLLRDIDPSTMTLVGGITLVAGGVLFLIAVPTTSLVLFIVAAVVLGVGFGTGFLGSLRAVTQLAQPHERSALLSAIYVVSYVAFSVPAVIAGVVITHLGTIDTAIAYGALVELLAAAGLVRLLVQRRVSS